MALFGQSVSGLLGVFFGYLLAVRRDRTGKAREEREAARQVLSIVRNDLEDLVGASREIYAKFQRSLESPALWTLNTSTWEALVARVPAIVDPEIVRRVSKAYWGFAILSRKLDLSLRFYWDVVARTEDNPELRGKLLKRFSTFSEKIVSQIERVEEGATEGLIRETNELIDDLSSYLATLGG